MGPILFTDLKGKEDVTSIEEVKLRVNNLIWMYGNRNMMLKEAESRSLKMLELILDEPEIKGVAL